MKIKSLMILLVVGVTAFFTVAAADVNSQDAAKTYKAPALENAESWTMVVVPDVQGYSKLRRNYGILEIMHAWIVDNLNTLRIQQVLFTGDLANRNDSPIVDPGKNDLIGDEQWKAFSRAAERLDGVVPYILCTGNHDYGIRSAENRHSFFNKYFPTDRNPLTRRQLIACNLNAWGTTTLENAAYEFTAPHPDNRKFLVISLQFAPSDADLQWAKKIADQPRFAEHIGIVLTHSYLDSTGKRIQKEKYALSQAGGNPGEEIFKKLVYPAKNIRLVICGHIAVPDQWDKGIAFSMDKNSSGKSVAQMAFNTQAIGGGWHGSGGDGWLRLLEFLPDRKTVRARTFSPLFAISPSTRHLAWKHDKLSEFTFEITAN
ncbi:MAG: serine/threonine protein phosphatase [Lentisphaerae bacterium]|nr:serine/threonine protein phosphatase [Lentisphaerota bacterium]